MEQLGEGIRKLLLAGIGAAAVTKEKSEIILRELVKKGELTDDMLDAVDDMDDEQLAALKERIAKAEAARSQEQPAEEAPEAPVESETAAETETEETK